MIAVLGAVSLAYYAYYYFDNFHYHVTRGYAHLGYPEAQHVVGQKLLYGVCCTYNVINLLVLKCFIEFLVFSHKIAHLVRKPNSHNGIVNLV